MKEYVLIPQDHQLYSLFTEVLQQDEFTNLTKYEVKIALVAISVVPSENGMTMEYAISKEGNPVAAQIRLVTQRDRVLANYDAVIEYDSKLVDDFPEIKTKALFEHELCHLEVQFDKDGVVKTTVDGRAALKLIPDDFRITGFRSVIQKYGFDSVELSSLAEVLDEAERVMKEKSDEEAEKSSSSDDGGVLVS